MCSKLFSGQLQAVVSSTLAEVTMKRVTAPSLLLLVAISSMAQQPRFDGKSWWHHVEVLAADDMEGRATGSPGLQRAEAYVVDQLRKTGLAPAGTDGYYQPIKFEMRQPVEKDSSAALVRNGKAEPLVLGEDAAFFRGLLNLAPQVEAPLVFLGYGLNVPEKNHDDFAGLDLRGKIAVTMAGRPEGITGPLAAHAMNPSQRGKQFHDAGLIGWILMPQPEVNWSRPKGEAAQPVIHLIDEFGEAQIFMLFNAAHANKLFDGTGHTPAELFALAKAMKALPRFDLPVSIRATMRVQRTPLESANIVAKLEGSDPALKNQYVVLSAHIDAAGIRKTINGDRIFSGAVDNASGCAALLDIATELKKGAARPRRSVLFVFFTAEEGALLGSKYFTAHPTVDPKSIVANVNIDEVLATVPFKTVNVLGLDESDMGAAARRASASLDIPIDPDERGIFHRAYYGLSDQYSFIVHGVPAVRLLVGFPGELAEVAERWHTETIHTPSDDLKQPMNLETAAKFEEFALQLLIEVANDPHRPEWKSSSFFKRYAAK
jgi:Zn-dependent M28 family amino/carboxypeptidase